MKMGWSLAVALLMFTWEVAPGQSSDGRYDYRIFVDHFVSADLLYGQNLAFDSVHEELRLDVYEPLGDSRRDRPLIILAHGGSLIFGSKNSSEMVRLGSDLARMGFVVASIGYRIGIEGFQENNLDSAVVYEANLRAVQDMRAAIRFFKRNVAEYGNTFGIDTSRIVAGGLSAGAIVALHTVYLDQLQEIPAYVNLSKPGLGGGIEGLSGNPGYRSSGLAGVINISGALVDTAIIDQCNVPLLSLHGDKDSVVPYGSDTIWLWGLVPLIDVDGSKTIHQRLDELAVTNCLYTFYGAGHVSRWGMETYGDTAMTLIRNFMKSVTTQEQLSCGYNGSTSPEAFFVEDLVVYPNPSQGTFSIRAQCEVDQVRVYDLQGRSAMQVDQPGTPVLYKRADLMIGPLTRGIYLVEVSTACATTKHRVLVL